MLKNFKISFFKYNSRHKIIIGLFIILWAGFHFAGKRNTNAFYDNGNPMYTGNIKNGKNHGQWIWYFPNGKMKMEGLFNLGSREGSWRTYYQNGNIKTESFYVDDKLNGFSNTFNEKNQLISSSYFKNDSLVKKP